MYIHRINIIEDKPTICNLSILFIYYRGVRTFEPHLLSNTNKKCITTIIVVITFNYLLFNYYSLYSITYNTRII